MMIQLLCIVLGIAFRAIALYLSLLNRLNLFCLINLKILVKILPFSLKNLNFVFVFWILFV